MSVINKIKIGAEARDIGVTWSNVANHPTSMPASDVHDWAKASSKPIYNWNEIADKPNTFIGATSTTNGTSGFVPAPTKEDQSSFLRGDGTWQVPTSTGATYTIDTGDSNGQIKVTPSNGDAYNVTVKGLNTAAYRGVDTTPISGSTNVITSGGVYDLIGIVGDINTILDNINGEVV